MSDHQLGQDVIPAQCNALKRQPEIPRLAGFQRSLHNRHTLAKHHQAVHVISTDAHDTERRPPVLSTARTVAAELFGDEIARNLVLHNPEAIVRGRPLPYFPKTLKKT